jgi:glycosyltransferase involved in cell wall biosynthesis
MLMAPPLLSIIVTNYNYARFLRDAIDSALAVAYVEKEVIVVDDGSTDGSQEIIASYGNRIIAILMEKNEGQATAANLGFSRSKGQLIHFLDSDDMDLPELMEYVLPSIDGSVAKVQYPMLIVDANNKPAGSMYPNFTAKMTPNMAAAEFKRTGFYECSPTSGNVYTRWFLEKIFPIPEKIAAGFDCFVNMAAPHLGRIVSLTRPLVSYRIHGSNSWAVDGIARELDPERFAFYVRDDINRTVYGMSLAKTLGEPFDPRVLDLQVRHMLQRLCYQRFSRDKHPITEDRVQAIADLAKDILRDDTVWNIMRRTCHAVAESPLMSSKGKTLVTAWAIAIAVLPRRMAFRLAELRFVPQSRPQLIRTLMRRAALSNPS